MQVVRGFTEEHVVKYIVGMKSILIARFWDTSHSKLLERRP